MTDRLSSYPNARRIAQLFQTYNRESSGVSEEWQSVFQDLGPEARSWLEGVGNGGGSPALEPAPVESRLSSGRVPDEIRTAAVDSMRARMLIRAFRVRGHLSAANLADRLRQIPGIERLVCRRGRATSAPRLDHGSEPISYGSSTILPKKLRLAASTAASLTSARA